MRIGGNRPIELTTDMVGDEQTPRFSPEGDRIAFRSGRVGQPGALYIMGATGESRRRLDFDGYSPDWSPDGTKLACSTEGYTEPHGRPTHGALVVIDIESGEASTIYAGDAVDPRWSPDGARGARSRRPEPWVAAVSCSTAAGSSATATSHYIRSP